METVDRRTEMPVIESCIYRALEREVSADTRVEETRAAAISVVGNLSAHVSADATGPDRSLTGTHRITLVQGNVITHVSSAVPLQLPEEPKRRAVALDLENNACLTLMFACTVEASHVTEEEVESVLRVLKLVGKRNVTALQWLSASVWCLVRSDDTRRQLLDTDCMESLIDLLQHWGPHLSASDDGDSAVVKFAEFAVAALWLLIIAPGEEIPEPETLVEARKKKTPHTPRMSSRLHLLCNRRRRRTLVAAAVAAAAGVARA